MQIAQHFRTQPLTARASLGILILRAVVGLAFVLHGWPKIQDPLHWMPAEAGIPDFLQALAAVAEFGGGLAWILGLLTPLASFGIACTMAVAFYMHAQVWGDPFVAAGGSKSYELALVYLCVALLLILAGPGRFSVDQVAFGQKP